MYKYKISGNSMSPTFSDGEEILVNRLSYILKKPKVRDIVAVKDPRDKKILIKRISRIEHGKYFVVGDNKEHSTDSRKFGMIEKTDIVGKVT
jgi:nickel-type superoxide dismutase maturation protease